ncbi:MAG: aldo/keto reductase [Saprospiraceae bacterium]
MNANSNLSQIAAGCMLWGKGGLEASASQMEALIQTFLEQEINTFDHADIYGDYTTEADFGIAYKQSKIERSKIRLITKCGIRKPDNNNNYIKHYNYDSEYIVKSCERSLSLLHTDYVDVFLLHRPDPLIEVDEVVSAISMLKEQGKILDFGVSNFTSFQTEILRQHVPIAYNQIEFSATHFTPMTDGTLDYMQIHKIRPMAWSPMGSFFKKPDTKLLDTVRNIAKKLQLPEHIILLSWILKHPSAPIPVIGTTNLTRIKALAPIRSGLLSRQEWTEIWTASMGQNVP